MNTIFYIKMNKRVLVNIISLLILQGSNYLIPLILIPFYIRTIGFEKFGTLAFATVTIMIYRAIVSYGFDLTGTKQIAKFRNSPSTINLIFSSIIIVKTILIFFTFISLLILISIVTKFQESWVIFIFTFGMVIGDALFPFWFFQGMEKMKLITYLQLSYKSIFVISIFQIIKNPSDYYLIPLIESVGYILMSILSLFYIKIKFKVRFIKPTLNIVISQFKNGFHIFLSNIFVVFYTGFNVFVLGFLTSNTNVGYYSLSEKIFFAIRGLLDPISKALFPFLSNLYENKKDKYYFVVKKIILLYFGIVILFFIITFNFSGVLIELISGEYVEISNKLLKILSVALLFSLGGFFTLLLVIKSKQKVLFKITFTTMFFNLLLLFPFIHLFGIYGIAYVYLTVQIFHMVLQLKFNKEIWVKSIGYGKK